MSLKSLAERKVSSNESFEQIEINQKLLNDELDEQKNHLERLEKDRARTDELHGQAEKLLTDEEE